MVVIATGGRYFSDRNYVFECLDKVNKYDPIRVLIHGGCEVWDPTTREFVRSGADWLADEWAFDNNVRRRVESGSKYFDEFGKQGGRIRNQALGLIAQRAKVYYDKLDHANHAISTVGFLGGTGTSHMCEISQQFNFKLWKTWVNEFEEVF